jgi:primosomal protein N'
MTEGHRPTQGTKLCLGHSALVLCPDCVQIAQCPECAEDYGIELSTLSEDTWYRCRTCGLDWRISWYSVYLK